MNDAPAPDPALDQAERSIYQAILARNPEHDFEPTLDRVRDVCALLGDPQHAFKVVHLTGTNGKTSTARMVESLVREHGLRTGLFTSPHLSTVRERIQIDGEPISQQAFVDLWEQVSPLIELVDARSLAAGGPRLSFFEVFTVLALAAFADAPVDVAVVEVGMGGGWDSTNVVEANVAVLTPVGLDHAAWLGNTIGEIAREKAGIIGPGCAVVVAAQPESAHAEIAAAVEREGARAVWEGEGLEVVERQPGVGGQLITVRTPAAVYAELFVPLYGAYQAHNAALAIAAVEQLLADGGHASALDGATLEAGFAQVTSPGRLEVVRTSPMILVDAAHNPHGIDAMVEAVSEAFAFSTLVGVVGILADKDAEGILGGLEPLLDHVVITQSSSPRAIDADELAQVAREVFGPERVSVERDLPSALDTAAALAEREDDMGGGVLVVGSITLVADTRILVGADRRKGAGRAR